MKKLILPCIIFLTILILTLAVYWPGLAGPFLFDDFANLDALGKYGSVHDGETLRLYLFGNTSGPGGRPLSMLSFLINDNTWPSDPWSFKYTNLLLHLLNGTLLCWISFKLLRLCRLEPESAAFAAVLAASCWLLHPFFVSTTLYVVQRMTQLAALFVLSGLLGYLHGRELLATVPRRAYVWMTLSIVMGTLLAVFSKENGALLPLLVLVVEWTALRTVPHPRVVPTPWWTGLFLVLPSLGIVGFLFGRWEHWQASYQNRPFTLGERVLTESQVLLDYLQQLLVPRSSSIGLFQESYPLSHGWLEPPSTLIAVILLSALLASGLLFRRRYPFFSLAVLFFFTGHLLESTILPLEIYFEHRNYLPAIFLFLPPAVWLVAQVPRYCWLPLAGILWLGLLGFLTYQYASLWGDKMQLMLVWAARNPDSVRAQRSAAIELESAGRPDLALRQLETALRRLPNEVELYLHRLALTCRYRQITSDELTALEPVLREVPYNFRTYYLLETLTDQIIEGRCHGMDTAAAHRLFKALLQNPTARVEAGPQRQLYHLQGMLYASENQPGLALQNFQAAQRVFPDAESGLLQVAILANHQFWTEALQHMETVRSLLNSGAARRTGKLDYPAEMERLERLIHQEIQDTQPDPQQPQQPKPFTDATH